MSLDQIASVDGRIAPTEQSTIALPDDGLYRGDGVFEVVRLYAGRPFAIADHLDRLERSASRIELPIDRVAIERELDALLAEHGEQDAQLRAIVTRAGRRILLIEPLAPRAPSATLASITYSPSVILDRVKSLSYAANMQATRIAAARGADEALLVLFDGTVLEPPTSTVFWVTGGELRTPSLELPILDSITRDRLIAALRVSEGIYGIDELHAAEEAFVASTTREVQPVTAVDGHELRPLGDHTRAAQKALAAAIERELG